MSARLPERDLLLINCGLTPPYLDCIVQYLLIKMVDLFIFV